MSNSKLLHMQLIILLFQMHSHTHCFPLIHITLKYQLRTYRYNQVSYSMFYMYCYYLFHICGFICISSHYFFILECRDLIEPLSCLCIVYTVHSTVFRANCPVRFKFVWNGREDSYCGVRHCCFLVTASDGHLVYFII